VAAPAKVTWGDLSALVDLVSQVRDSMTEPRHGLERDDSRSDPVDRARSSTVHRRPRTPAWPRLDPPRHLAAPLLQSRPRIPAHGHRGCLRARSFILDYGAVDSSGRAGAVVGRLKAISEALASMPRSSSAGDEAGFALLH